MWRAANSSQTISELYLSEHVGTSVWMSRCSDSEFRELHSARGSHPWDCDVFDTMRHSDQNTPPLQHKVEKELFLCLLLSVTSNHSCPSLRMSGLICTIRHDRTKQDQPGLCKMSPLEVTELTIDLKLHKHGCKAGYLPPINLKLNHAPLSISIINL